MKETKVNSKDVSVKLFTTVYRFGESEWVFEVRRHHSPDPRFEGVLTLDSEHISDFVMIRSTIGKWLLTGEAIPTDILEHAQEIGKAFEDERPEIDGNQTSEGIPGDNDKEELTTVMKLPARGRESS